MKIKGLILKDWYTLQKTVKIAAVIFIILWVVGIFTDHIGLMFFYPCILGCVVAHSTWNFDERGWEKFAFGLPCSEKEIVLSKYIPDVCIKIGMISLFVLLRGVRSVIFDVPFFTSAFNSALILILVLYILCICLLPLYVKFRGVILGTLYFLIGALSGGVGIIFFENEKLSLYEGPEVEIIILFCIFLCVVPISYYFSLRQYKKRDC